MSLLTFQEQFADEATCVTFLEEQRWGKDGKDRFCPHCGSYTTYAFKSGKLFKCADCRKQFTVRVGTIFEGSHLSLRKWFYAAYLNTSLKKGISSIQLAKYLTITQKSAWFMLQRIRYGLETSGNGDLLGNIVEVDETYVGGVKRGGRPGPADKAVVFGAVERKGSARLKHVPSAGSRVLLPEIAKAVKPGTIIYSDQLNAYRTLGQRGYAHSRVNHSENEYVRDKVHTNTIDGGVWSHFKHSLEAIYVGVSAKHLQKYCSEFEYRYNTREMDDGERFAWWFKRINGRITYKALIG